MDNPLTKARQRLKAHRAKRAEELAAKHAKTAHGYLGILQDSDRVYLGTANRRRVQKRRARNRVAKQSRKANRS